MKKLLTILMLAVCLAAFLSVTAGAAGGKLEEDTYGYYKIEDYDDLLAFADLVNSGSNYANAKLMKEINASASNPASAVYDSALVWTLIGTNTNGYRGTFDGQGCSITGLTFNDDSKDNAGLFGYVYGTVKNVTLTRSSITGKNYVGGIAGYVGSKGLVENCAFDGNVSGKTDVGGVVGHIFARGSVKNCYNTGTVSCHSAYAGGIMGYSNNGSVENCYSAGSVGGGGRFLGGVAGFNAPSGTLTNCYYDRDLCTIEGAASDNNWNAVGSGTTSETATGLTTAEMTGEAAKTYMKGFDFINVWAATDSYPVLRGTDEPAFELKVKDTNDTTGETSDWQDTADYDIGDAVPFKITVKLGSDVSKFKEYDLDVCFSPSSSFSSPSVESVMLGEDALSQSDYSVSDAGGLFTVSLSLPGGDDSLNNAEIAVCLNTKLNESAASGKAGNPASAYVKYPSLSDQSARIHSTPDWVNVFTHRLEIKAAGFSGLTFKLEKYVRGPETDTQEEISSTSLSGNTAVFHGIDDGIYKLTLSDGSKTIGSFTFTVTAGHNEVCSAENDLGTLLTSLSAALNGEGDLTFAVNDDLSVLTVSYKPSVYTVTFNGSGGTTSDGKAETTQTVPAGQATALDANPFTREGYAFDGWNTEQNPTETNPGTFYGDKASVTLSDNLTLYAQWKKQIELSGSGTKEDPYKIGTADELFAYAERAGKNTGSAELTNTINLGNKPWNPVILQGSTFDGKGFEVSGLNVTFDDPGRTKEYDAGLFFYVDKDSTVQNLTVRGTVSVRSAGRIYAGGIASLVYGTLENCISECDVTATSSGLNGSVNAGGVAGSVTNEAKLTGCSSTGQVTASGVSYAISAGGVVGLCEPGGTVEECCNSGTVSSTSKKGANSSVAAEANAWAGGIAGKVDSTSSGIGAVRKCYNTGMVNVNGDSYAYGGGITGENVGEVVNCYNTRTVSGEGNYVCTGGLFGINKGDVQTSFSLGAVNNSGRSQFSGLLVGANDKKLEKCTCCYLQYDKQSPCGGGSNLSDFSKARRLTEEEFRDEKNFKDTDDSNGWFDFDSVWIMGEKHPLLRAFIDEVTLTFNGGGGTTSDSKTETTQTVPAGKATALDANPFEWTGYTFTGWNTKDDGSGTPYTDKEMVTLSTGLDLYAQWKANDFTVSITDPASYTYDGTDKTPSVTVKDGPQDLTEAADYTVKLEKKDASGQYAAANEAKDAGDYKLTVTGKGDYAHATQSGKEFTVKKAEATVKAKPVNLTYGDPIPASFEAEESGVTGDTLNYTLTCDSKDGAVGDYPITVTLGENPNYTVTATNGVLTIGKKAVTVKAKDANLTYGDPIPTSFEAEESGVITGDTLKYTLSCDTKDGAAAEYPITVTLGENPNYTVTATNGKLTIKRKAVTVTADNAEKTVGREDPAFTVKVEGLAENDTFEISYSFQRPGVGTDAGEKVGDYAINVTGEKIQGNYEVSFVPGTLTIKAADKTELNNAIKEAENYYDRIRDDYPEIAEELKEVIDEAKGYAADPNATENLVEYAKEIIEKAVTKAENKEDFEEYKEDALDTVESLKKDGDSREVSELIADAEKAVEDLRYDEKKTPAENKEAVDKILSDLKDALSDQRGGEKEDFENYKEEAKETADRLLWPNDTPVSIGLVTDAKEEIDELEYDEDLTPAENREAVDAILEELIEDLFDQREKEALEEAERNRRRFESIRIVRDMQKRIEQSKPAPEPPVKEKEDALPFTDVSENDPFYSDILYVYENGIMNGTSPTEFTPFGTLTRGMIVTILYRMEGEPAAIYSAAFWDVPAGEWYTPGVEWAAANKIVLGFGDGTYGPSKPVTREQLAAILYRYAEFKEYPLDPAALISFASGDVSPWAAEYAAWALTNRILPQDETGSVRGTSPALRWEVAAAVKAFLEVYD